MTAPDSRARSGRHRRGTIARGLAGLSDWYHQPFDYRWIIDHQSTRPLHRTLKIVIGSGVLTYALASVLMLISPLGVSGTAAVSWVLILLVIQVGYALFWFFGPVPGRGGLIAFAVFADVGLASALPMFENKYSALVGCILFVISGAFCTYFLSPRGLVAHLVFSIAVICVIAGWTYLDDVIDVASLLAALVVVLGSVGGVPLFAHIAWTLITRDARLSVLDPLTGLLNRRGWDTALEDLWARGLRERATLVVLLIDIDQFKHVNDHYGHHRGDEVIVLLARRLRDLVGEAGIIARTGGEEFLAAGIGQPHHVNDLIDRIGDSLHSRDDRVPITVSVGAAVIDSDSPLWSIGVSAVGRASRVADTMMYRAKDAGGDRVFVTEL